MFSKMTDTERTWIINILITILAGKKNLKKSSLPTI